MASRSRQYTKQMIFILGNAARLSCPVNAILPPKYELFTASNGGAGVGDGGESSSLGIFDDVVFACHASTAHNLLQKESHVNGELVSLLGKAANCVFVSILYSSWKYTVRYT